MPTSYHTITAFRIEGFHCWPEAPPSVGFLRFRHRHLFHIRCWSPVEHPDRAIEFISHSTILATRLQEEFGNPAEFGRMSCEEIGEWLLAADPDLAAVEVLEDGEGGSVVKRGRR